MDTTAIAAALTGAGGTIGFQFSSNISPPMSFDLGGINASGEPSWFTKWLQPQMTLLVGGVPVQNWAPYGSPNPPDYIFISAIAIIFVLLILTALEKN